MICVIMFFASYGAAVSTLVIRDTVKEYLRRWPMYSDDDKPNTPVDTPDDTHNEGFI